MNILISNGRVVDPANRTDAVQNVYVAGGKIVALGTAPDGFTAEKLALAKPDAIVMHPGPMNRGVEIDSAVADGAQAVILPQVTFGIAVRMAVMSMLGSH